MKLREKFKTEFSINTSGESGGFADKCIEIADNFTIGFSIRMLESNINQFLSNPKELLEIYKKEKNL